MVALFLPEGLSVFVGDFRLSPVRIPLIVLSIAAMLRFFRRVGTPNFVLVPSDLIALAAGIWMIVAATAMGGTDGLKASGALALEFTGTYYVFRYLLGPVDSCVRLVRFSGFLIVLVVCVALLDPLTGTLFTYESVKAVTGYAKESYETAKTLRAGTLYRDGMVRAMGPLEHSILFGAVCAWFGTLVLITFRFRPFGWGVAGVALIGIWFSLARAPLLGYFIAFVLLLFYMATPNFTARWRLLGSLVAVGLTVIFFLSGSPIATLLRLALISPEAGWYRQAIWQAAVPQVANSPIFGIGSLTGTWDYQVHGALVGTSVDAFWLAAAMMFGVPGSLLIFLTMAGAFWRGAVDRSPYLSREERHLSVALGIVVTVAVFLGFTVHFWGACWILLGAFSAMRANLAEAAVVRGRAARIESSRSSSIPGARSVPNR
jgi:hypothetical protein